MEIKVHVIYKLITIILILIGDKVIYIRHVCVLLYTKRVILCYQNNWHFVFLQCHLGCTDHMHSPFQQQMFHQARFYEKNKTKEKSNMLCTVKTLEIYHTYNKKMSLIIAWTRFTLETLTIVEHSALRTLTAFSTVITAKFWTYDIVS